MSSVSVSLSLLRHAMTRVRPKRWQLLTSGAHMRVRLLPPAWVARMLLALLFGMGQAGILSGWAEAGGGLRPVFHATPHDAVYDLAFDGPHGIAVGAWGLIVETEDAGMTWRRTDLPSSLALLGVDLHGNRAIAVGQMGCIFRRSGGSWQPVESGTSERLLAVASDGGDLVVAVGGFGTVLISHDGGVTWHRRAFDWSRMVEDMIEPHLYAVDVKGLRIVIVGEVGLVLRSEDGGLSWTRTHEGAESLFGLDMRADGVGFAVGQKGVVLNTIDDGRSWSRMQTGVEANFLDVWVSESDDAWISGIRTLLYRQGKMRSWSSFAIGDVPVSWYGAIATPGRRGGLWLAGHSGRIVTIVGESPPERAEMEGGSR